MAKVNTAMPSVGQGDCSMQSISPDGSGDGSTPKETLELMNVSPGSDNSPQPQHSNISTLELIRQNEWLKSQKLQLEAQLLANQSGMFIVQSSRQSSVHQS